MNHAVHLNKPFRQEESDPFYQMCLAAREGDLAEFEAEHKLLATRKESCVSEEESALFNDALLLCPFKDDVWEHNLRSLDQLGAPIVKVKAKNNGGLAASATGDECGLKATVYLAKGARVMLTMNIWTKAGLVNGTMGTIEDFYFAPGSPEEPAAVLVRFPQYPADGPCFPGLEHGVLPITPSTVHFKKGTSPCERTQYALALAWSVTIHKSQGMTIGPGQAWERMVLNLGNRELSTGLTFVAISRAKSLKCILFKHGTFPTALRLTKCKTDSMQRRKLEDERLMVLSELTLGARLAGPAGAAFNARNAAALRAGVPVM